MTSVAGTLAYDQTVTSTVSRTLETDLRLTLTGTGVKGEWFVNMNDDATPQVDTITVNSTLAASNAYYKVTIAGSVTRTYTYQYLTSSSDTAATIASALAALISLHPDVSAVPQAASNNNKIDVTAITGAFTTTVEVAAKTDDSAVSNKLTVTSVAGSGTLKQRKVAEATVQLTATASGGVNNPSYPELQLTSVSWYKGDNPPTVQSSPSITKLTGPLSLDALRLVT